MAHRRRVVPFLALVSLVTTALPLLAPRPALAQPKAPPAKAPPGTKTDMEIDPDAKKEPPPPLPPPEPGQWGVGGKEEEGRFAPGDNNKKKEEEQSKKKEAEEDKKPVDLGPPRVASLDTVIGFGTMRDVTNDSGGKNNGRTSSAGASFIFGFSWRFADIWTVGARFPFTRASVDGPGGAYNTFSNGNLELLVKPSFQLTRRLRLPAQLSLFLPTGQGDFFPDMTATDKKIPLAQAQLNQFASYSRGWEEMPLFAPHRFGMRLGAGITWDTAEMHVAAGTRLDLMFKTGGGEPYTGYTISSPTLAWTTYASFHYDFLDGMVEPGLRAWLTYASLPVTSGTRDYSGAQFVLEPQVNGRFPVNAAKTMAVKAGLGFILPVSGHLGGAGAPFDASIKGFRINGAFEF